MKPILSDLSTIYRNHIKIVKLDIEQIKHLVKRYRIQAKSTFLFLKNGEVVDLIICLTPRKEFEEKIVKLLTKLRLKPTGSEK
jgi:thioredoxin 1